MKRSNSKKETLPEDGAQQKISSFFQKGPAQAQSKLFTTAKRSKPPLTLMRQSNTSKMTPKISPSDSRTNSGTSKTKTSMTALREINSVAAPQHKTPQKSGSAPDPDSPGFIIIPDTPEEEQKRPRPKPASRSFLCPASLLSTMPGKRPSPPKSKPKRLGTKPMGPVSVAFTPKSLEEKIPSLSEKQVSLDAFLTDKVPVETASEKSVSLEKAHSAVLAFGQDVDYADFDFEPGFSSPVSLPQPNIKQPSSSPAITVTPTKSYVEGNAVKRMAVSGLSPAAKRTLPPETLGWEEGGEKPAEASTSQRMVKAKRQLAAMSGFKDVKEMNQSVNMYQLGGNTKGPKQNAVTSSEDDVLADILGQMHDGLDAPAKPQLTICKEKCSKASSSFSREEELKPDRMEVEFSEGVTRDDDILGEILGELDGSLCQKRAVTSQKHGLKPFKRKQQSKISPERKVEGQDNENYMERCQPESGESVMLEDQQPTGEHSKPDCYQFDKKSVWLADGDKNVSECDGVDGSLDPVLQSKITDKACSLETQPVTLTPLSEKADFVGRDGLLRLQATPTKVKPEDQELPKDVEDMLAQSFCEMSPFKGESSSQSCQASRQSAKVSNQVQSSKFTDKWNRFNVQDVSYDRHTNEITLEMTKERDASSQKAILRDSWSDTHIAPGDTIHFLWEGDEGSGGRAGVKTGLGVGEREEEGVMVVDDREGQVVVNPDLLLSGTTIVSGVYCLRRSVLNEKFKGVDSKNVHMLYGSIIHSLFQEVLRDRLSKTEEILATAKTIVQSNKFLHEMYGQSALEARVMEEIKAYVGPLQTWLHKHVPPRDKPHNHRNSDMSVVQIHDIEENIWSPRLGVKGKIDMTVEVEMKEKGQVRRKVVPLELKTGKASYSVEHKGQVTLYSMMMSERRQNPEEGLLLYLKHNAMNSVPVKPQNTRGLLQLRNELAYYLSGGRSQRGGEDDGGGEVGVTFRLGRLPPPINSPRSCSTCPHLTNCAIYQRSVERLEHGPGHAMSSLVPETLAHLGEAHLSFFTHWLRCMELEAAAQRSEGLRNIWCMGSDQREAAGDCLQQLVIVDSMLGVPETQAFSEGKGCCVQFCRKPGFEGVALDQVGLSKNDSVVISTEDGKYIALSTGFIRDLTDTVVDVVVDRDSFHENTSFQSLVFRIDRCDVFNTAGYLLTNLSRLMEPSAHSQKLRSLIIDGRKPEFQLKLSKTAVEKVKGIFKPLNKPQKTAILKVLMSKDFVLIKGYPGTGKTSTIVALVKILRAMGQSVLLTSYTHSAVDNILLKLKKDRVPFLRLGRASRIHPEIREHAAEILTLDITSVAELRDFYSSYDVVASSCLGVRHPLLSLRRFDVCIVDEASQVLLPACLGPLFSALRFVLVGDPQQLSPVVQSREASALGMGQSLFMLLDGAGATYDLNLQYRMNSTIMQLSNELVYHGALCCGTDSVSTACLQPEDLSVTRGEEWLKRALDPGLDNAVIFLDTSQISAPEKCDGKGLANEVETNLIQSLCVTFVQAGISASEMGVIAPYRAQVRALKQRLSECFPLRGVEVNTVDQFQGRDKSVVLISFVRSASPSSQPLSKGGLLHDVRRLNVAVTRAKHKLVMVGDRATLTHYPPLNAMLGRLADRGQIFALSRDFKLPLDADV